MRLRVHSGGCQCGAVRFAMFAEPEDASICHCRMCQKAFGSYFGAFAAIALADFEWTRGAPAIFASSDVVDRGFCADCGTPLTFVYRGADTIDIAIGAFDHPERIKVTEQIWTSARIPGFDGLCALPSRPEDTPGFDEAVEKAAATNHQHPDRDTEDWPPRNTG